MIPFIKNISAPQLYGSGLAAILISLILYWFSRHDIWLYFCFGIVILLMLWPAPFRYFAIFWLAFGELLGFFVSRLILSAIYILVVIPVSLFVGRKIRKSMQLSCFKSNKPSAFKVREHQFTPNDFEKPF